MHKERWLLPDGIDEILPPGARIVERLRRDLLDLYHGWGYELVIPPMIEYLESLLTGTGHDLDLQTFKLIDQISGRLMGVRADITPQVARMDAHRLRREGPARFCYLGTVLHTRLEGFSGSRSPLQIGAEIYGHAGIESDVEILRLMMLTLRRSGVADLYLDLGHVGIFRGLARQAGLAGEQELELFEALQRKAIPEIAGLVAGFGVERKTARMLVALAELNGGEVLPPARDALREAPAPVQQALDYLQGVAGGLRRWLPEVPVHFDLAELRGYHYKSGVVFAAFVPGSGQEIARGGRYDDIGRVFGRARPAVGFSADLKTLIQQGRGLDDVYREPGGVLAPWSDDGALQQRIEALRREGRRVLTVLPGQPAGAREMGCTHRLVRRGRAWVVEAVSEGT